MFHFDYITKGDMKEHNSKWSEIPDHPHRILIIGGSGSRKTNALLNLINHEPHVDKNFLYAKDSYQAKYQKVLIEFDDMIADMLSNKKNFIQ